MNFLRCSGSFYRLPPSNVKSLLLLPLIIKGKLEGAMGFSNCDTPRRWSNSEVELLRVATADIALAIEASPGRSISPAGRSKISQYF